MSKDEDRPRPVTEAELAEMRAAIRDPEKLSDVIALADVALKQMPRLLAEVERLQELSNAWAEVGQYAEQYLITCDTHPGRMASFMERFETACDLEGEAE